MYLHLKMKIFLIWYKPHKFRVDSESFLIKFDNHAFTCMAKNFNHFIVPLRPINKFLVKEYSVMIKFRGEKTFKCKIEDDDRKVHSIIIHNVNYFPESPICLISQHQWSQHAAISHPSPDGTTLADCFSLACSKLLETDIVYYMVASCFYSISKCKQWVILYIYFGVQWSFWIWNSR